MGRRYSARKQAKYRNKIGHVEIFGWYPYTNSELLYKIDAVLIDGTKIHIDEVARKMDAVSIAQEYAIEHELAFNRRKDLFSPIG